MRNIAVFAVLVIMLNCAYIAAAQEEEDIQPYTFSSWTHFGVFLGRAEEIVYPSSKYKAEKLSQLLWDIKPVWYYGLSLDFSRTEPMDRWGFFATVSLRNGIPGKSGIMEDRDWASVENDALTHFSTHDNLTNTLFFCDVSAGLSLPVKQFLLKTYVSMAYMHFSFTGQYGSGTYAKEIGGYGSDIYDSIDNNPDYKSFKDREKVINYTQNWLTVAPGIALGYYLSRFYGEVFFNISPLISCAGVDEHLYPPPYTPSVFKDYMHGGIFVEPGFHFTFFFNKRLDFTFDFSWRHMGNTRGKTWNGTSVGTATFIQQGEAGAGLSLFNLGLCAKIHL